MQLGGRDWTRTIGNWLNYRDAATGLWAASDPDCEDAPEDLDGESLSYASRRAPLQAFVGDGSTALKTGLLALREAAHPGHWIKLKWVNVNTVATAADRAARTATWPDIWAQTDLRYQIGRARVEKLITLKSSGHPASFRCAFVLAPGHTYAIVGNSLRIYDETGAEWLRTPPAWARDAADARVRVAMVDGGLLGGLPTIRLVPNATDLSSAVYPVRVDPTATLSGTTAIEDAMMISNASNANYGGYGDIYAVEGTYSSGSIRRTLMRIATASIPAGTISAFRAKLTRFPHSSSANPGNLDWYAIKDAKTWVEGTSVGAQESGAACWDYARYNTLAWASAGCGTSGTDYDAGATPPTQAFAAYASGPPASVLFTFDLKPEWPTAWRDATRVNNGMLVRARAESSGIAFYAASSEYSSNQPTFEIDYTAGLSLPLLAQLHRRRR
jgi:hypothetical protein